MLQFSDSRLSPIRKLLHYCFRKKHPPGNSLYIHHSDTYLKPAAWRRRFQEWYRYLLYYAVKTMLPYLSLWHHGLVAITRLCCRLYSWTGTAVPKSALLLNRYHPSLHEKSISYSSFIYAVTRYNYFNDRRLSPANLWPTAVSRRYSDQRPALILALLKDPRRPSPIVICKSTLTPLTPLDFHNWASLPILVSTVVSAKW